jgi:hypothetical protein
MNLLLPLLSILSTLALWIWIWPVYSVIFLCDRIVSSTRTPLSAGYGSAGDLNEDKRAMSGAHTKASTPHSMKDDDISESDKKGFYLRTALLCASTAFL